MTLRALLWLVAAFAVALAPAFDRGDAKAQTHHAAGAVPDCHDHAPPPPPDPCSDHGTAKHAAGECCPMMVGAVAVLSLSSADQARPIEPAPPAVTARHLTGLSPTKDPPPPRA